MTSDGLLCSPCRISFANPNLSVEILSLEFTLPYELASNRKIRGGEDDKEREGKLERERKRRIENFHRGFKTLVYRSPILWRRKGGRKGVARRTKRRGPPRSLGCSRSGVEHPTDGNVRRNSVQPRAQALPLLSAIFLSLPFRIRSPISIRLPPEPLSPSTLCIPRRVAERAIRQLFRISFRSRLRYARCSDRRGGERVSRLSSLAFEYSVRLRCCFTTS